MEHKDVSALSGATASSGAASATPHTPEIVCAFEKCTIRLLNPCGHDMCRIHALCSKWHEGKGSYWSRDDCAICTKAWESVCNAVDPAIIQPALVSLRIWVGGFSRNTQGPYLDFDISRSVLFPKARLTAVVGVHEDASGSTSTETTVDISADVSPVEKQELHRESSPSEEDIEEVMSLFWILLLRLLLLLSLSPAPWDMFPWQPHLFSQLRMNVEISCYGRCSDSGLN